MTTKKLTAKQKQSKSISPEDKKLTGKQSKFRDAFLVNGFNAKQAAITAGYSEKTAANIGSENLTKPHIKKAVEAAQKKTGDKMEITRDMIAAEFAKIAFGSMGNFATWDDEGVLLVDSKDLTDAQKAIVSEITETKNETGGSVKLKLHSKTTALADLAKLLGLNKPTEIDINMNETQPINKVEIVVIGADKKPVKK